MKSTDLREVLRYRIQEIENQIAELKFQKAELKEKLDTTPNQRNEDK